MAALNSQVLAVTWKVQSNKPSGGALLALEQHLANDIEIETQGDLILDIRPENGHVGLREAFNALRRGYIDAMFMTPQYWGGADPVFPIMGDLVAAWNSPEQYIYWLKHKGGIKHLEAAYQRFGLKLVGYIIAPAESLIATVPVANISDIKGQVMRTPPGMITDFFQLLGARTRNITTSKIASSIATKKVSIADLSNIVLNNKLQVYQHAKHTNYPGFHSMPLYDFVVNQKSWDALPLIQQHRLKNAMLHWQELNYKTTQKELEAVKISLDRQQVTVYQWEPTEIIKARKKAVLVWDKYAKKSPRAFELIQELKNWLKESGNIE